MAYDLDDSPPPSGWNIYALTETSENDDSPYLDITASTPIDDTDYWRGHDSALPSDDIDLQSGFDAYDESGVSLLDGQFVEQRAIGANAMFLFKKKHTGEADFKITWTGKSSVAGSSKGIY